MINHGDLSLISLDEGGRNSLVVFICYEKKPVLGQNTLYVCSVELYTKVIVHISHEQEAISLESTAVGPKFICYKYLSPHSGTCPYTLNAALCGHNMVVNQ